MNFLSPLELTLIVIALLALLLSLLPAARSSRWLPWLSIAGVPVALLQVALEGTRWEMMPVYTLTGLLFLGALLALLLRRRRPQEAPPRGSLRRGIVALVRAAWLLLGLFFLAFPLAVTPMISNGYRVNLREAGWVEGFDAMHARLAEEYPFTEWKGIDWEARYERIRPRIAEAEASGDVEGYYLALREYVYSIPDGHVRLVGEEEELMARQVGGGYGLGIIGLDDGRVIVHVLAEGGPAAGAGIEWGAEIVAWNGRPVAEALDEQSILWARMPQATAEGRRLEQYRFLVRDPVGTEARVTFRNPGESEAREVTLSAVDDGGETLARTDPYPYEPVDDPLEASILPGGYGYLHFLIQRFPSDTAGVLAEHLRAFEAAGVRGVIVDLRGNRGGSDFTVSEIASHFFDTPTLYQQVALYNQHTGHFEPIPFNRLDPLVPVISYRVTPRVPRYDGPLAVLVDKSTLSSAEGIALLLQRLPNAELFGFHGTNGILGAGNYKRWMLPGGYTLQILEGRSLDSSGRIQVDGNAAGEGGVNPDTRIPLTEETLRATYLEERDLPLEYAITWIDQQAQ